MVPDFDYIIAGAGCAGLSLAVHLIQSGKFNDKKILLIDSDGKTANDRTWCFWEEKPGLFESILYHKWEKLWFHNDALSKQMNISPYWYKMIRGIDFYDYCLSLIRKQPNFTVLQQKVDHIFSSEVTTGIITEGRTVHCNYIFNSIIFNKPELSPKHYWLLQHFKGWIIETQKDFFDPQSATLMDFRTGQDKGTAFCYVLPFSPNRALVEYTLFSGQLLSNEEYTCGIKNYIENKLGIENYFIREEETGSIPMTNFRFSPGQNNITNIGTAGGQTKGSSGYTFNFIQKHCKKILHELITSGNPYMPSRSSRFHFYDSILLNILYNNNLPGSIIFSDLFVRNEPSTILKFLDNRSSLLEDLSVIATLPKKPFLKAALQQLF